MHAMHSVFTALSTFRQGPCRAFSSSRQSLLSLSARVDGRVRSRTSYPHALAEQASTSDHGGGDGASPASSTAPPAGVYGRWRTQWTAFLGQLYEAGHFAADPQVQPGSLDANKGAVKRAVLSFARQRADLRYSLPAEDLRSLVLAGFPRPDRKSINAYKRLEASILRGQDLTAADGGPADFQDLARMLYALSLVDPVTAELESPGLASAACNLMPLIIKAAQEPNSASSQTPGSTRGLPRPVFHSSQRKAQRERWQPEQQREKGRSPAGPPRAAAGAPEDGEGTGTDGGRSSSGGRQRRQGAGGTPAAAQQRGLPWWDEPGSSRNKQPA